MFLGRLLASVALSLAVASSTAAVPSAPAQGVATRELSYYPAVRALSPLPMVAARHAKRMTNAERMARGLPPNAPRRRAPGQLRARTSPTPTSDAPSSASSAASTSATDSSTPTPPPTSASSDSSSASSAPSSSPSDASSASPSSASSSPSAAPTCDTVMGRLAFSYTDSDGFSHSGWLGAAANSFGEFPPTTDGDAALVLTYEVCGDATGPVSFTSSNGFSNFPILAAINGFANTNTDLGPGSYNYAYVGATGNDVPSGPAVTQPNSFSAAAGVPEGVETAIWSIGAGSHPTVSPVWINSDGTPATNVQIGYVPASNAFAFIGDMDAFGANFGTAMPATFSFVTGFQR